MASNAQDRLRVGGILSYATNFSSSDIANFPTLDGTNFDAVVSIIEAAYSFDRVLGFQNFVFNHTPENEQTLELDDCDIGEASRNITFTPDATFDYFNVDDVDVFAQLLGIPVQSVPGVLTPDTQDVVNPSGFLTFIKIANQNFDGSVIVVSGVSASVDGALVDGTDYQLVQNALGEYGIQLISGTNITTLTQTFTISYEYTPAATRYTGYEVKSKAIPFNLLKFETCPNENNESNVYYGVKYSLTSDYAMTFANLTRDGVSETPASLTLSAAKGGLWIECKQTLTVID